MMEWKKYSEIKESLAPGDVVIATFKDPESINRVVCTCYADVDSGLCNVRTGHRINNIEPDYAFVLTKPDQFIIRYFV